MGSLERMCASSTDIHLGKKICGVIHNLRAMQV
jgi:hypothetical protein